MFNAKKIILMYFFLVMMMLAGCARVAIYSDENLKTETGVKYYIPKPYLLVAKTGAKDNPVSISVIYLPDLKYPFYAKAITGLGSSNLSMAFTNGMLSTFGEINDSKIPELITALGSLTGSAATAAKTFMAQAGVNYTEKGATLVSIAGDLDKQFTIARTKNILTRQELQIGESISKTLVESGNLLQGPQGSSNVLTVIANITQALKIWENIRGPNAAAISEVSVLTNISKDKEQTSTILDELQKATGASTDNGPVFLLYEIDNITGTTTLRPVN
jgi:hypothetical protein